MTPKEKAKELYDKFFEYSYIDWHGGSNELTHKEATKECALIAVNELIQESSPSVYLEGRNGMNQEKYWQQVKEEINKL